MLNITVGFGVFMFYDQLTPSMPHLEIIKEITDTVNDVCMVPVPAICNVNGNSLSYWLWLRYLGLYGTSLIETVTAPARPVQIRAHHHIDVYADINNIGPLEYRMPLVLLITYGFIITD